MVKIVIRSNLVSVFPEKFPLAKTKHWMELTLLWASYIFACQFNRKGKQNLSSFCRNYVLVKFRYNDSDFSPILVLECVASKATADRTRQYQFAFCRSSSASTIQGCISSLPCLEGGRGILTCWGAFSVKSLARKCSCKLWPWECNLWLFCIVG